MRPFVHWLIIVAALFVALGIVPGIRVEGNAWLAVGVTAIVLGIVNLIVRPILSLLSCGLIVLTLGLFLLVINGLMLWLASSIAVDWFHVGFRVDGFWAAFWGGLVVSIVSWILSIAFGRAT